MTMGELRQVIGILLYMACVHVPGVRNYWRFGTAQQICVESGSITYNRHLSTPSSYSIFFCFFSKNNIASQPFMIKKFLIDLNF